MKKIVLTVFAGLFTNAAAVAFDGDQLSGRYWIDLPALNALPSNERKIIIDNAIVLTEKFNRFYTIQKNYGLDQLQNIKSTYTTMSDVDFVNAMIDWSLKNEDKHADFILQGPFEKINYFLPIEIESLLDASGQRHFYVKNKLTENINGEINTKKISIGDEILKINNVDVSQVFQELLEIADYANLEAKSRKATRLLYFREAARFYIKTGNERAYFEFRDQNNNTYYASLAWYATAENLKTLYVNSKSQSLDADLSNLNVSEPGIAFKVLNLNEKKIMYIKVFSFFEYKISKKPLETENYDGIIIDVRENFGGNIQTAENFSALFTTKKIKHLEYDFRVNEQILPFVVSNNSGFFTQEAILDFYQKIYIEKKELTSPLSFSHEADRYTKKFNQKTIVLADALCFSACENFVSIMKNQVGAVVVGVSDHTTAGGGAAVASINERFLAGLTGSSIDLSALQKMPYGFDLTIPFAAAYNFEQSRNSLIQDVGVSFSVVVPKTLMDIKSNDKDLIQSLKRFF